MRVQTLIVVAVICVFGPAAQAEDAIVIERIVAVVDDQVVLSSEVDGLLEQVMQQAPAPPGTDSKALEKERRDEIVESLIAEKLLEAEVRKLRIDVTEAEVERVVQATMQENNLDDDKLKMALARQGMNIDDYKSGLKKQLTKMKIIQLKVKSRVNVTDQDVQAAARRGGKTSEYRVHARHILFLVPPDGAQNEAKHQAALQAKKRLDAGAKFEDVAAELSEDPGSKTRGGDLGEFGRGDMVPEFEAAAFAAEPGAVVGPVKTAFGWHLILVDERVTAAPKSSDQVMEGLRQKLYESEVEQQFKQYIDELKRDAWIDRRK